MPGYESTWLVDPEKKKVIVYDFEQEEIPKIYGLIRRFRLEYSEENARWILRKSMKKSDLYMREKKNRNEGDSTESPSF